MSVEQERAFLQPFFARAEIGEIATAEQIQQAFEAEVKRPVHISTIYRLLDRHGWRKLVPRPRHPKANEREQAIFKKTFQTTVQAIAAAREPADQRPVLQMAEDEGCGCRVSVCPDGRGLPQVSDHARHSKWYASISMSMLLWLQKWGK